MWKKDVGSRGAVGAAAAITKRAQGHLTIRVDGRLYQAHHLAWLYIHGEFADRPIRHKDGDRSNNRLKNLELASRQTLAESLTAKPITPATVHDIFSYADGLLKWKHSLTGSRRVAGMVAGSINNDGYVIVEVAGKSVAAHRIVWLMHNGHWPTGEIDHINGIRHDNRIENLRDVHRKTNAENRRSASKTSKTKLLGVEYLPKIDKYRARIRVDGALIRLGTFNTPDDAHAAYIEAKRRLHAGCSI